MWLTSRMTPGRIFKVMFVLCVSFTQWSISISQCPKQFCTCTGKRVACVKHERHLRFIPSLPKHTEVLVFTGNFLPIISQETFRNISGLRLRELSLGGNKIRNISSDAFEVLKSLIFLDLSGNQFPVSILQESFHGLRHSKLKKLYLIEMALPDLPSDMFKHLQNVSTLHGISLNFNKLQNFVGSVFSVLKGLRYIGLNNNSITNVDNRGSKGSIEQTEASSDLLWRNRETLSSIFASSWSRWQPYFWDKQTSISWQLSPQTPKSDAGR